jgi:TatD DNase family protein
MIDTHCHLNHPDYAHDLPQVLLRAKEAGVTQVVCVGYDLETSTTAIKLANEIEMVYASVGIHPHDAQTYDANTDNMLRNIATSHKKVVAIGETGLDYYRNLSPQGAQQTSFRAHIQMAHELGLPLIVHTRDAQSDVLAILKECGIPSSGVVMHCLPSDPNFAKEAIELGCYIGIAGPVTFQNAAKLREIVSTLPLEQILLETDSPYLTPHPHRGKRNEPCYLSLIVTAIATILNKPVETVISITTSNAKRLFNLP